MIKVIVELIPKGRHGFRRTIASMRISNIGDGTERSDYDVEVQEALNPLSGTPSRTASMRVLGHQRDQSVWKLIGAAIEATDAAEFVEL